MARNPYNKSLTHNNARSAYTRGTEPDMRFEFNATLDGVFPEIAKKQKAALRRLRLNEPCSCIDEVTGEADKDTFCPFCWGEAFNWDEVFIDIYKVDLRSSVGLSTKEDLISPGIINIPLVSFYVKSSVEIKQEDRVIQLELNKDGSPVVPFRRKSLFRIGTLIDFRSDNGKLEYYKLDCHTEQRKFLNGIEST